MKIDTAGGGIFYPTERTESYVIGNKRYDLVNHLGNVLATVTDKKVGIDTTSDDEAEYYMAQVETAMLYYDFGWGMPGRQVNPNESRHGQNGQEKSLEIDNGHYTAEHWEYDSRSTRRWNVDPRSNTSFSPYATFECSPIAKTDGKGDTAKVTITNKVIGQAPLKVLRSEEVIIMVDVYEMTVTDTEDPSYKGSFGVTRDAFAQTGANNGNIVIETVNFEPSGNNNYTIEQDYRSGYPPAPFPNNWLSTGSPAYRLRNEEGGIDLQAMENPASVSINPPLRENANEATSVLIHVGGNYVKRGRIPIFGSSTQVAGSAGCFGIVNPSNPNEPSNFQMDLFNAVLQQRKGNAPIQLNIEQRATRTTTMEMDANQRVTREVVEDTDNIDN